MSVTLAVRPIYIPLPRTWTHSCGTLVLVIWRVLIRVYLSVARELGLSLWLYNWHVSGAVPLFRLEN